MKKVNNLTVKVTYTVGLGNLEMPDDVHNELIEAQEYGDEINHSGGTDKYPNAAEWLRDNIRESDCYEISHEIIECE